MSHEQFKQEIKAIHQQLTVLRRFITRLSLKQLEQVAQVIENIAVALNNLQLINDNTQRGLEASKVFEETEQNEQEITQRQHYYDLFQFSPDACIVTDINGLILEANFAIAKLLKTPQSYLIGKSLTIFIDQSDRQVFNNHLNQLSSVSDVQTWELSLCPQQGEAFTAQLKVAISCNDSGFIEALQIGVRDISEYKQLATLSTQQVQPEETQTQALDGLQVLIIDDEADAREFITAILESHGIQVTGVATVAAALKALETFHPDVLVSDIRMPDEDGYVLIRKLRELEAQKGWHIPTAALTAYLTEDREKALAAGFESHLHKLAQPTEFVEMVAQLAGRISN